ncbi:MAG TPA: tRNA epoxyqueuosine(34) reductase QueG [Roseiarcus sp.]|nr:tRNA epoxyqueuosine(34) reductase QueG [Roseiarcus sp.]
MRAKANQLGFDHCGITRPAAPRQTGERLAAWIADGRHGDMDWMARTFKRRADPRALWSDAKSIIMLAVNYRPDADPMAGLAKKDRGVISVYARNRDYHDVMKGRLKQLAAWLVATARPTAVDVKVFVDTAPVMEKPLAAAAGVGWQGKHTNLVSRDYGSWLFLGALFTDLELTPDAPETDHCGTCRACLDICPTRAFPAPYQLDARRCISYLTIEHKGHIAREFRVAIGNRIYGCDDCLAVCPWNKFAKDAREAKFAERADLASPRLAELIGMDEQVFRSRFSGGPIKRLGHTRFLRNVLIAIGNSGEPELAQSACKLLSHPSPVVRAMAVWALSRLTDRASLAAIKRKQGAQETDLTVLEEWLQAGA